MTSPATADLGLSQRKLYVATKLTQTLVDELERLERELQDGPLERPQLLGRADELLQLAWVLHDELGELELS